MQLIGRCVILNCNAICILQNANAKLCTVAKEKQKSERIFAGVETYFISLWKFCQVETVPDNIWELIIELEYSEVFENRIYVKMCFANSNTTKYTGYPK